ncbi:hypothetical protein GGS20DRAFT_236877 [Poronia punctata]|nr:hypothetical protein GGS20DRAFT_236877 [Poronia punctata]
MAGHRDISMTSNRTLRANKSYKLVQSAIKAQPYAYVHLELLRPTASSSDKLDAIQVRSFCTVALKQFLGVTGIATPLDILKVEGHNCWLRIPQGNLSSFSAAITTWHGTTQDGLHSNLRIRGCSAWLGALVGQQDDQKLWTA